MTGGPRRPGARRGPRRPGCCKHALRSGDVQRALGRIGGRHGGVDAYLGLAFIIAAVLMAVVAAGQVVATREEEASSRLDNLLVRPVGRSRWLAGRFLTAAGILAAGGLALAVFTWAGAASQSSGVSFRSLIEAGLNTVPPAMFLLGLGTLVHAAAPRLTAAVVYGLVGWSFLIEFLGSAVTMSHWVLDTSLLYHVAPAPAASPQWVSAGVLVGLGAGLALAGCAVFQRRDLAGA